MIKYCYEKWDKNKGILESKLREMSSEKLNDIGYNSLLKLTVDSILNDSDYGPKWNTDKITTIDDGDYQGTFLFLIPEETYQPSAHEYLMTYIYYGSCSGCDTLQHIQSLWYNDESVPEEAIKEFMMLCKDFIMNMVKPYNFGWRHEDTFDRVTMDEEDD